MIFIMILSFSLVTAHKLRPTQLSLRYLAVTVYQILLFSEQTHGNVIRKAKRVLHFLHPCSAIWRRRARNHDGSQTASISANGYGCTRRRGWLARQGRRDRCIFLFLEGAWHKSICFRCRISGGWTRACSEFFRRPMPSDQTLVVCPFKASSLPFFTALTLVLGNRTKTFIETYGVISRTDCSSYRIWYLKTAELERA